MRRDNIKDKKETKEKKGETKDEIIRAIDAKSTPFRQDELISRLWSKLGPIKARCDKCGHIQSVETVRAKRCVRCRKTFQVIKAKSASNIVYCNPRFVGTLHRIISLEHDGKDLGGL